MNTRVSFRAFARNPHIALNQGIPRCAQDDTPRVP
jgi:hypothetical protein